MDNLDNLVTNSSLTPKEIVLELDRYIIGQKDAKRAVAIALRNRERRMNVEPGLREEITPRNILMIGPTGVGKTEIARRLAKLADSPFAKVETTKFTEVGYVGRDVESIIKDLTDIAYNMTRAKFKRQVREQARNNAEERVLDALVGTDSSEETREKFREMLRAGALDDKEIEIKISENNGNISNIDIPGMNSGHIGIINITDMVSKALGVSDKKKLKRLNVAESYNVLIDEEEDKLLNEEKLVKETISMVESKGIVFLDEIDKIAAKHDRRGGDVSREGVQRDLLPLIEGCFVSTKYGMINTSHILFIASGAFHTSKPSDLLPELQGRLPIRVELQSLTKEDMMAILIEPEASLIKQYIALIKTEKVELVFTDEAIQRIAEIATEVNNQVENIGARRLHTIMEKLLEDCSFNATEELANTKFTVDKNYVELQLEALTKKIDLTKFIL